jgi:hypothetical protein
MVSFTDIDYATAWKKGNEQEAMIKKLIDQNHINELTTETEIDSILHTFMQQTVAS